MKKLVFIVLLVLFSVKVFSQQGYHIRIKIKHFPDTSLLLTSYYGDKIKRIDTAYAQKPGEFIFTGKKKLSGGIYMAISTKKIKLFEFIVNKNQNFDLSTDTADYTRLLKERGSIENKLFFNYLRYNEVQYNRIKQLSKTLDSLKKRNQDYEEIKNKIDSINKLSIVYKLKIIHKYPDLFVTKVLDAMREVEVPADNVGNDSLFRYHYFKRHFWDDFDLSDSRLLRTPLYNKKVNQYFKQLVVINPDSVIKGINYVIAKAQPSTDNVSWLVWHFTAEYQNPKYMGFDKVFVYLVDNYFSKEPIANTTASVLKLLKERADKIRPLLIGKTAPELILMDTSGRYIGFKSLPNKYTLLLFWDYKCGICKREIKELQKIYPDKKYDLEIYAININPDLDKWKKAVHDRKLRWINVNGTHSAKGDFNKLYDIHGTPVIYLLDRNKNIIAKQIGAKHINDFLDIYVKNKKKKK